MIKRIIYTQITENADELKIYWRCENRACKARLHTDKKHIVQQGMKCKYHEADSLSQKIRCFFFSLASLPVDDVDRYEELIDDDDIP